MAEISFSMNRKGIHELLLSPQIQRAMNRTADVIADQARATAPVRTGEYKASIRTREHPTRNRARAEVVAHSEHSILVEWMDRTMGKAADAARFI